MSDSTVREGGSLPSRPHRSTDRIRWFEDLRVADAPTVGGKGANLGELTSVGFPVPSGFVVPASVYLDALDAGGVRDEVARLGAGPDDPDGPSVAARCRVIVAGVELGEEIGGELTAAYRSLGDDVSVAVRSSAPAEDAVDTSFAGIHESFTGVRGEAAVADAVRACWASLWSERAVAYRRAREYVDEPSVAVVVQRMVASDQSGVVFTADPRSGATDRILIEAAFGLGEVVVGGQVEPDSYVLAKPDLRRITMHLGTKLEKITTGPDGDRRSSVAESDRASRVLDDAQLDAVARLAMRVEQHYGIPQDLEFAIEGPELWLVQTRPITTLGLAAAPPPEVREGPGEPAMGAAGAEGAAEGAAAGGEPTPGSTLVRGLAAGPGIVTGRVRVLHAPTEGGRILEGEILVAPMTNPDWLPALRKAAAIVTDGGGITCHAAIVGRELHRPVVVGARTATTVLHDGQMVTVDGDAGVVLAGAVGETTATQKPAAPRPAGPAEAPAPFSATTATAVYVNLAVPDEAERVAALPVDGVGLLRAEFMIGEALGGRHPSLLLAEGRRQEYVDAMAEAVGRIAAAFAPRPVIYRAVDLRSNEFRELEGGSIEPDERNPMIGYRGCYRYIRDPELFRLDLDVVHAVRQRWTNLHLMIPFVRTHWELKACLAQIDGHELGQDRAMRRWIMAEVPSVVHWLPAYAELGIHGVSIGTNDLTQLMLGVDRDSEACAELFDTMDPAVLDAIDQIIERATAAGLTSSLCGQAPSDDADLVEHLVRAGITSVSVTPDVAVRTRATVARAEQRIILRQARSVGPAPR